MMNNKPQHYKEKGGSCLQHFYPWLLTELLVSNIFRITVNLISYLIIYCRFFITYTLLLFHCSKILNWRTKLVKNKKTETETYFLVLIKKVFYSVLFVGQKIIYVFNIRFITRIISRLWFSFLLLKKHFVRKVT